MGEKEFQRLVLEMLRDEVLLPKKWQAMEARRADVVVETEEKIEEVDSLLDGLREPKRGRK